MNLIGKFKKIFVAAVVLGSLFARATTFVVEPGDDIAAAIDQAQDDDVVQIAAGTYIVSAGITIDRAITIRGVHSAVTTIKSTGDAFTVFTLKNARAIIERVTIRDAVAPSRPAVLITGGGGTLCDAVICNCKATNQSSNTGAVFIDSADAIVRRVIIKDCSGSWGGGLFINKNATVDCCYLTGNSAQYGGGFYINSGGLNPLIVHLSACENGASYGKDFYNNGPGSSVTKIYDSWIKSAGGGGYSGSNNKSGAATTEELVDKGIPIDGTSTTDVNGLAYDTVNPAIGSHALVADPITITWLGKTTVGLGTQETAVFSVEGVPEGASVSAALYDPEGVYVGGSDDVSPFDFKASEVLGDYTLIVTVDDQSGSVRDIVKKGVMNASLTEVHVSKTGSGEMPYATEATALTDIQMAIDACAAGGTVIVHDGTYELKATVCVEKPLTVRSQSGRDKTILVRDASSLARPLYINHAGACVEGFTIRNGKEGSATPKGGSSYGGGVQIGTAGGLLDKCIIENCINGTHGGAIALRAPNAVVRRSIIRFNEGSYGGAVYPIGGGVIDNCLIYKNKGSWGGALYNETRGVEIVILNSTILDNTGGGDNNVCNYGGAGRLIVSNSICSATGVTVKMNLLTTTTFVNREAYDYSLLTGATAIDAGTPYEGMPDTDVFGNPRVSGVSVDVGAAEYQVGNLNASLVVDSTMRMFNPGVSYTLTPTVDGAVSTPSLVWTITRGDGVKVVDAQVTEYEPLVFSPALPGAYSVRLSVTAGEKTVEVECPDMFVAGAREVFVNERGGDVYPYATEADAAHDFNSAWAFVGTNAVVHVAAGTYELAKAMEFVHPIRVEGAGRDVTVLRSATGANDRIAVLDHSDAVLRNCTLAGVRLGSPSERHGACVLFNKNGGLVENCRLTDNQGTSACRGGAVAFLGNSKGVLRQCQIDGNATAGTSGWGGGVYTAGGGVLESCLIVGNSGAYANGIYFNGACAITNCTLVDGIYFDGAWNQSKIANTIISSMNTSAVPMATTFSHCLKKGYAFPEGSVGNLSDDPCFVDAETGDYHLGRKSPCRGAGLYEPWMRSATDLDGKPRASADTTDIGCYARPRKGLVLMVQ